MWSRLLLYGVAATSYLLRANFVIAFGLALAWRGWCGRIVDFGPSSRCAGGLAAGERSGHYFLY